VGERTVTLLFFGLYIALAVRYGAETSQIVGAVGQNVSSVFGTLLGSGTAKIAGM
jgi:hypothetical protein